jgi:hypothetical protein
MASLVRKLSTQSGLSWDTVRRYAKSNLLERDGAFGEPIYMHSMKCPNYCDYACNGRHGSLIAKDVDTLECNIKGGAIPMNIHESAARLLRESAFATLDDVRQFIEWYDTNEHHSRWDDQRYEQAKRIAAALAE